MTFCFISHPQCQGQLHSRKEP